MDEVLFNILPHSRHFVLHSKLISTIFLRFLNLFVLTILRTTTSRLVTMHAAREANVRSCLRNLFASLKPILHIASRQYTRNVSRGFYHFTVATKRGISSGFRNERRTQAVQRDQISTRDNPGLAPVTYAFIHAPPFMNA